MFSPVEDNDTHLLETSQTQLHTVYIPYVCPCFALSQHILNNKKRNMF